MKVQWLSTGVDSATVAISLVTPLGDLCLLKKVSGTSRDSTITLPAVNSPCDGNPSKILSPGNYKVMVDTYAINGVYPVDQSDARFTLSE